ncbi:MAG: hypothetical protein AAF670_08190 [Planctomycetota bacterium]
MRLHHSLMSAFLVGLGLFSVVGCGSGEATVAPRSEDEIAAYKADVYAAEEEDDLSASEDE